MPRLAGLLQSLVGKKIVMAVTGMVLFLWLLAHMIGNLHIFEGPESINHYARWLREIGAPVLSHAQALWLVRAVLILAVGGHIWAAWAVTRASWAARPVGYKLHQTAETTYAARTMRWGGVLLILFVVYHLLDLTFGRLNPAYVDGDVYHNVVASFSVPLVAGFYILAMAALGLHLYHGLWSGLQTLGLHRRPTDRWRRSLAAAIAVLVFLGFISVPVAVLAGVVR
ncbi:MAG TPA: succinate dehydrogenase cytochrome b subunit [Gemmatimonadales bacterium]|nr:succinate dehydrogenase cytochrome b subunit [Gemmatimonadales bacterium]